MKPIATILLFAAATVSAVPFSNGGGALEVRADAVSQPIQHEIRGHKHPPKDDDCDDGDSDDDGYGGGNGDGGHHGGGGDHGNGGGNGGGQGGGDGGSGNTYKPCTVGEPKCCSVNVINLLGLECSTPTESISSAAKFEAVCAKTGKKPHCCTVSLLGQGLVCTEPKS
ncbi:fungal hydrophobin domain-containing protein [Sarocladium implicatum]|nr:fungal hydrophobin domain-containing protein [Sarocladium implicatum]